MCKDVGGYSGMGDGVFVYFRLLRGVVLEVGVLGCIC